MNHSFATLEQKDIESKRAVVFLPGWGFDGRILSLAEPQPAWICPEQQIIPDSLTGDLNTFLSRQAIEKIDIIGWSMGAMLGIDFTLKYPQKVAGLTLVSLRPNWPEEEIESIRAELNSNPSLQLAEFYRKCFLGDKKKYRAFRDSLEGAYLNAYSLETLNHGLDYLRDFQMPSALPDSVAIQVLHGRRDIIAPSNEMVSNRNIESRLIEGGHAFFLNDSTLLMRPASKKTIQQRFSKAALTYDQHAVIQRDLATRMTKLLEERLTPGSINTILEIGCGTGNYTEQLARRYAKARLTAVDFAPGMIEAAKAKTAGLANITLLCEDGEKLLNDSARSYDLITSNATLQWFPDLEEALAAIAGHLNQAGLFLASIFGPATLAELSEGLSAVLEQPVIIPARSFPDRSRLQQAARQYFTDVSIEEYNFTRRYESAMALLTNISRTGTSGGRNDLLHLTKSRIEALEQWFHSTGGTVRVTYQVFFLQGERGA